MSSVRRITLFKIPSESDIAAVLKAYDILKATNLKVFPSHSHHLPVSLLRSPGRQAVHPLLRRGQSVQYLGGARTGLHGGGAVDVREQDGRRVLRQGVRGAQGAEEADHARPPGAMYAADREQGGGREWSEAVA